MMTGGSQFVSSEYLAIKTANRFELSFILDLQRICYQSEAVLYDDYTIQPLTQTLTELADDFDSGTIYLTGYIYEKLIASVRGNSRDGTGYIRKLIVDPEYQNKGYGKLMMNAIENDLKDVERFELFTGNKSEKNIVLYKKLGYEIFDTQKLTDKLSLIHLQKQTR